jgi:hypothetical protein
MRGTTQSLASFKKGFKDAGQIRSKKSSTN